MEPKGPKVIKVDTKTLLIICFRCGKQHEALVDEIQAVYRFRIICSCGQPYQFGGRERRNFERREVNLVGDLLDLETQQHIDKVTVTDLSLGGFGFTTEQRHVKVGESFILSFQLDDQDQSQVEESIVIRSVAKGQEAGAELIEGYSFDLDLYLNS